MEYSSGRERTDLGSLTCSKQPVLSKVWNTSSWQGDEEKLNNNMDASAGSNGST